MEPVENSSISFKTVFNQQVCNEFEFAAPPEAPVFRPNAEDFAKGPLEYIKKIRPLAEQYGICKIIPPADFKPAFEVESEKLMFKPRVQRINELEASTRAKLCFFEKIIKYWNLQGSSLKIPVIDRKMVDLYMLHRTVAAEGGFETCVREKKWLKIANKLYPGTATKSTISFSLRQHYERILYPYDIFVSGATTGIKITDSPFKCDSNSSSSSKTETSCDTNDDASQTSFFSYKRNSEDDSQQSLCSQRRGKSVKTVARRSSARINQLSSATASASSSFANLMIKNDAINERSSKRNSSTENIFQACKLCNQIKDIENTKRLLECEACKNNFHLSCLIPPLQHYPRGKWNCPQCVADLVPKLPKPYTHEFGFAESKCKYSLTEFGSIADTFKQKYFDTNDSRNVKLDDVEREFWRLVTCIDDMVTVEYGADLHTNQVGSGFATEGINNKYVNHPWNLNRLPLLEGSLFKYINSNINGMIVPWIYVGMCFSTFCWHNEDHWTYSINYLHWGEPKTWYGVPGDNAEQFENAMIKTAPELFEAQPDLLHQLVTICNPNILQKENVPIYRTNQLAGEFVVTFPRSYHAGFNQGFNLAEAVNFAPLDWLHIGRQCMDNYTKLHRFPVFSHDELICNMGSDEKLNAFQLSHVFDDMLTMVESERNLRKAALEHGITKSVCVKFDTLSDDKRQCDICKTTCYLSGLACECSDRIICLSHLNELCNTCSPKDYVLKYSFRLDELAHLLKKLENKLDKFEKWSLLVKEFINNSNLCAKKKSNNNYKLSAAKLFELKQMAVDLCVPTNFKIHLILTRQVQKVQHVSKKMQNILNLKTLRDCSKSKVSLEQIDHLLNEIDALDIILERTDELRMLYEESKRLIDDLKEGTSVNSLNPKFNFLDLSDFIPETNDIQICKSIKKRKNNGSQPKLKSSNQNLTPIKNAC